ncbi:hypothetical protein OHU17_14175 [Streptomyces goshikiensis]|uniref:Gram-positive cocci surface proteins LPxTG domain-containing protein n=1 Tax=Streptomyces goshikiensis TaxID=1942 RepID=A0ABZ1RJI5_9ACTN|nr:hypothetical protein [Streptomyces goshikiensis]
MRTALRTSIVTAALAGAMLVPAAGSAFAAPAPQAVTSTKAAASQAERVVINKHLVADMVNSATEAPSVKIFIVNEDGTTRPKTLASLDRGHTKQSVQGTVFTLTKAETAEPVLTVFENGVTTSFPLPKGKAATPAPSENDRYAGQAVSIGNGMVAVLRNKAEGPEAWIRYVGPHWQPGDSYMLKVLTVLNRQQTTDSAFGASFKLTKAETTAPVLVVTTDGVAKSYPLPKGKAGQTCAADSKIQDIGAGTTAELYMSSNGPKVVLRSSGSDTFWRILDRGFPALNKSDGIIARIVNPSGSKPVFEWQTQGGGTPLGRTSFPSLPTGCELNYKVTEEQTGSAKPAPKPSSATTGVTTQTQAQTPVQAQTAVVPKGSVAAGAELPVETVADTDDSTTLAAGAGLFAIVAALGASVLRRRRNHG